METAAIKKIVANKIKAEADCYAEKEESENQNRFQASLITDTDLDEQFKKMLSLSWRIKGILPETAYLNEIYGPPGSYKSFIAIDMALSIAAGIKWHNRAVKKCDVVYIAAEGQSGVLKRVKSWQMFHDVKSLKHFSLLPLACLIDEPSDLTDLITAIQTLPIAPGIIFIDTLARNMTGDENSTKDMGKVVLASGKLTEATSAQVVFVHHSGKDQTRGPRGAIALTGATDCLFEIKKEDDRLVTLICERQKDDEPFTDMTFRLEVQTTGYTNDDGEEMCSLIPVYDPDASKQKRSQIPKIQGTTRIALKALERSMAEHGQAPGAEINVPPNVFMVVHEDYWRRTAYDLGISDGEASAKKMAFKRARARLMDLAMIGCFDGYYWKY